MDISDLIDGLTRRNYLCWKSFTDTFINKARRNVLARAGRRHEDLEEDLYLSTDEILFPLRQQLGNSISASFTGVEI